MKLNLRFWGNCAILIGILYLILAFCMIKYPLVLQFIKNIPVTILIAPGIIVWVMGMWAILTEIIENISSSEE